MNLNNTLEMFAGGPGSGRRPNPGKGLKPAKPFSELSPKAKIKMRKNPKQASLFGPEHTKELSQLKSGEEQVERENGPITPPPGQKRIVKQGTQFCVESDGVDKNFGCWPSREQAQAVADGKSFIEPLMKAAAKHKHGGWKHQKKEGKYADVTHHAYKTVRWGVHPDTGEVYAPGDPQVNKTRAKWQKRVEEAQKTFLGGIVASVGLGIMSKPPVSRGAKIGHMKKERLHRGHMGIGHRMTNPSMHKGKGVGHRFTNPSFGMRGYADYGEPMAGALQHAHLDTNLWFHPPSEKNPKRIPTDDPGEKNNRFLDVTKRKEAHKDRMKLLKRSSPGGLPALIPAKTTLLSPHQAAYTPGMFASRISRNRRRAGGGMFRAFGAAQI